MEDYIEHVEKNGGIVDLTVKDNYTAARVYSKGDSRVAYFDTEENFTGLVDSYGRVVVKDSVTDAKRVVKNFLARKTWNYDDRKRN